MIKSREITNLGEVHEVACELLELAVTLRAFGMAVLERVDLEPRARVECKVAREIIDVDRVLGGPLRELVPDDLERFDRVLEGLAATLGEDGEHGGLVEHWRRLFSVYKFLAVEYLTKRYLFVRY